MLNAPLLTAAIDAFKISDLRRKLLCTFEMLVASRFIAQMPVPYADLTALQRVFQTNQPAGFFDLFSKGALSSLSVAALASIPTPPLIYVYGGQRRIPVQMSKQIQ